MSDESAAALVGSTFEVSYQSAAVYNRDLAKRGTLTIRPGEYVFRGRARRTFFSGGETEVRLAAGEIRNVVRRDACVQFVTPAGKSGQQGVPFLFFCRTEAEAGTVVDLLPKTRDASATEAENFQKQLEETAPAAPWWRSATSLIIAVNVLMFLVMGLLGAGWFETASMQPYLAFAANNGAATTQGEWWRLITSMFSHYGLLHLACNMWALSRAGPLVERLLGRTLYVVTYFGSGIIGGLATIDWHGDKVWSAGASGAIFGVYGALLGYLWREKHGIPRSVVQPMMKSTVAFAGYNLFYGAIYPQIDNVAHLGGLAGGVLLGWLCALPLDREVRAREWKRRFSVTVTAVILLFAVGAAIAPRFDYNVRDEVAWSEAIQARSDQERKLLEAGQRVLGTATNANAGPAEDWVRHEAIPFYRQWRSELNALQFSPQLVTAKRRDALVHIMDLKLQSYDDLVTGLAAGDANAGHRFATQQADIAAAIQVLAKIK